jgi:hypothetical protein
MLSWDWVARIWVLFLILNPVHPAQMRSSSTGVTAAQQPFDPVERSTQRAERFLKLVELRALYRNFVRAKFLLRLQSPIYTPPDPSDASRAFR